MSTFPTTDDIRAKYDLNYERQYTTQSFGYYALSLADLEDTTYDDYHKFLNEISEEIDCGKIHILNTALNTSDFQKVESRGVRNKRYVITKEFDRVDCDCDIYLSFRCDVAETDDEVISRILNNEKKRIKDEERKKRELEQRKEAKQRREEKERKEYLRLKEKFEGK